MSYEQDYHTKVHKNLLDKEGYYLFRAKYASEKYLKYLSGDIFEFGCGVGQNIFPIKKNAVGVDISEYAREECSKRDIKCVESIYNLEGKYSGCLSVHTLEHLENPLLILRQIHESLVVGGRLVLVLPVYKSNIPEKKDFAKDISGHLYYWNFYAINNLLHKAGFKVKSNEFNYAAGFSLFYRIPLISRSLIYLLGAFTGNKEMIIVAEK